jgi:hypothetical protein
VVELTQPKTNPQHGEDLRIRCQASRTDGTRESREERGPEPWAARRGWGGVCRAVASVATIGMVGRRWHVAGTLVQGIHIRNSYAITATRPFVALFHLQLYCV